MANLILFPLLMFLASCKQGITRSIVHDDSILAVTRGTFYALEPFGGVQNRWSRRHVVDSNSEPDVHLLRLDLGPELTSVDMELRRDSVWTNDSQVVVRRGEWTQEVNGLVDASCFLSGRLTSQDGAVSLNRCGRLTGMIQAGDFHYEIESQDSDSPDVKVTLRRSDDVSSGEMDHLMAGREERASNKKLYERQFREATTESVVYLNSYFIANQARLGRSSTSSLTTLIINKWNVMRTVLANEAALGFKFNLQLKKIEIWRTNPSYYGRLGTNSKMSQYLSAFCRGTPSYPDYDHKMLYTYGGQAGFRGMAYQNGICREDWKCSIVKSADTNVKVELHEFGHNLGMPHDPDMAPCSDPYRTGGFMGWGSNYRILDCYQRKLKQTLADADARCLYQTNVNRQVLNNSG